MTDTNRALNRLFVFMIGLILLAGGGAVAIGAVLPDLHDRVATAAKNAEGPTSQALSGGMPWILWVAPVVFLVVILLLLWFVFRQGHGRTSTVVTVDDDGRDGTPSGGTVSIDTKVAAHLLEEDLSREAGIVTVDVTAFTVRRQSVLRVTVQTRRGASPLEMRRRIDRSIEAWDALLGIQTPVVVQIVSGIRNRTAGAVRVA